MKWIKLKDDAIIPTRATIGSAGYDVYANETVRLLPNECKIIKTGISFKDLDTSQYIQMSLRSSISIKRPFIMPNSPAIIDSDYSGNEIGIILWNRGNVPAVVDQGEKIAQCIIISYHTVDDEKTIKRKRVSGFGSTDS
jgi:dUTP pyrophosphatase